MEPQLYIGQTPATAAERHLLRQQAIGVYAALRGVRQPEPTYILMNAADYAGGPPQFELLLLRSSLVLVGILRSYAGPIEVTPDGGWALMDSRAPIREATGQTPLQLLRDQRDAVRLRLGREAAHVLGAQAEQHSFERLIAALICTPSVPAGSHISLDVDDHRQLLKILGLDELAGLVAMLHAGPQLSEEALRAIAADVFGGRLWHDGERFLFDLAPGRFQLHVLDSDRHTLRSLPLPEGETVLGRRQTPKLFEHRLTITGDDLISSDHALILCGDGDLALLRDTSKNGTRVTPPGGAELRLRGEECRIGPGTLLRMGQTYLRLELAGRPGVAG